MMTKGMETRARILAQAAPLLNQHGFFSTPLAAIMAATGLQKGGLYNHFASKEQLALEAFDHAVAIIRQHFIIGLRDKRGAVDRLAAIIQGFCDYVEAPFLAGGCPVMNSAIESDDAHPALRQRAQAAMHSLQSMVARVIERGVAVGELRPTCDPAALASVVIATLEGALMLSKLYSDPVHMQRAASHLHHYIQTLQVEKEQS